MRDSPDNLYHPGRFLSFLYVRFFVDESLPGLVNEPGLVVATLFEKSRSISFYLLQAAAAKTLRQPKSEGITLGSDAFNNPFAAMLADTMQPQLLLAYQQ